LFVNLQGSDSRLRSNVKTAQLALAATSQVDLLLELHLYLKKFIVPPDFCLSC
jgi:hypothetical protein